MNVSRNLYYNSTQIQNMYLMDDDDDGDVDDETNIIKSNDSHHCSVWEEDMNVSRNLYSNSTQIQNMYPMDDDDDDDADDDGDETFQLFSASRPRNLKSKKRKIIRI